MTNIVYAHLQGERLIGLITGDPGLVCYTPGETYVEHDPEVHGWECLERIPILNAPTERWVTSYRFLFELHSVPQYIQLDGLKAAADRLTDVDIGNFTPGAVNSTGIPLDVLRLIRVAYQQMERLNNRIDLLSTGAAMFFAAVSAIGLYGSTSEQITAEIARIQSDTVPV